MINHKNNTDDFLKDFIQKADMESPSADFTKIVMQKINVAAPEPSFYQQAIQKIKGWYFLAIIGAGALVYTMYYFLNRDSKLLAQDFDPIIFPIFKRIFQSFTGLFHSMQISSFTVVIILAIVGLFLVDRLISKLKTGRQIYFSF
jgi:hypothetical protein